MKKILPQALLLLVFLTLSSCKAETAPAAQDPAAFVAQFTQTAQSGDEAALRAYEGNTYRFNARAEGIVSGQYILVRCTDRVRIRAYLPPEELEDLSPGEVIGLEGSVKEVKMKTYGDMPNVQMILDPAHVAGDVFEITGEVEAVFQDLGRDGQKCAAVWDNSVMLERQINVYLPENPEVRVGDRITARGGLLGPSDPDQFCMAYIPDRGFPEVFVMPEPLFVGPAGETGGSE